MKPYTHNKLADAQAYYNNRHSSARMNIEQTIGLIKGRFRILLSTNESSIPKVNVIILHNIYIIRELTCKYEWILARKDIHMLDSSEEDDVDIVARNLAGAAYFKKNPENPDMRL